VNDELETDDVSAFAVSPYSTLEVAGSFVVHVIVAVV
jgi:hypothetical protein